MPLLEVTDLDKTFTVDNRSVTAIDRLSLAIDEHEFVSIVGPSGCGKSTFLHILGGFEPATAGDLRLNGTPDRASGSRSRHDVPGALAVSLAHRHRERRMAARDEGTAQARAPSQGRGISRSRSPLSLRRPLSGPVERGNEATRRAGAAVRARPGNHADGRAVRRARLPDPGTAAGRAAVDLASRPQDRALRHP